jgi:hypothetical protein
MIQRSRHRRRFEVCILVRESIARCFWHRSGREFPVQVIVIFLEQWGVAVRVHGAMIEMVHHTTYSCRIVLVAHSFRERRFKKNRFG